MKITTAVFETSAVARTSYPTRPLPEFAFIGRSNVGKSSLINMLTRSKGLAKISGTPGKTRLVNFFLINDRWRLVDLPGYGFAAGSKRDRADFNKAAADYLEHRPNLACVFVLIDSRLPPQHLDLHFLGWLATCPVRSALVFTKIDKEPRRVSANVAAFTQSLAAAGIDPPDVFLSSATKQTGRRDILGVVDQVLAEIRAGAAADLEDGP